MYKLHDSFLGFTDTKTALQKAKIEKTLSKLYRYQNQVMKGKEFILYRLIEGWTPSVIEDYSYFSSKTGQKTKPKNDYRMIKEGLSQYREISKTEYDFANFIIENGYLDEQKRIDFIKAEQDKKQAEEQKQAEVEQEEQNRKEIEKHKKEEFEKWWQTEAIKKIEDDCPDIETMKKIYTSKGHDFQNYAVKLLVMIDNFDLEECRNTLKSWLHHYNIASILTFEAVTGIGLGRTDKQIQAVLSSINKTDFRNN